MEQTVKKSKGGRPAKPAHERVEYICALLLTPYQRAAMRRYAEENGLALAELTRIAVLEKIGWIG